MLKQCTVNKHLKSFFILLTLLLSGSLSACELNEYQFITEEFPPYNFQDSSGVATGMNTDLVVYLFKKMELDLSIYDIKVWPWARGYREVQNPISKSALYSTTRTDNREELFKWVGPLSYSNNTIIVKKGNPASLKIESDEDFKTVNVIFGAIRDDIGHQTLLKYGVDEKNINLSSSISSLMKMLQTGRIDAISYNKDVFFWLAKQEGYSGFEPLYTKELGEHYIAFPLGTDDSLIQMMQEALNEVRENKDLLESFRKPYQG